MDKVLNEYNRRYNLENEQRETKATVEEAPRVVEIETAQPIAVAKPVEISNQTDLHVARIRHSVPVVAESIESASPVIEVSNPVVEVSNPVVEVSNPVVEVSNPVIEVANPVVQVASPVVQVASPVVEVSNPVVEISNPVIEVANPVVQVASPMVEVANPVVKVASPVVEVANPVVEVASPVVEVANPVVEVANPVEAANSSEAANQALDDFFADPEMCDLGAQFTTFEGDSLADTLKKIKMHETMLSNDPLTEEYRSNVTALVRYLAPIANKDHPSLQYKKPKLFAEITKTATNVLALLDGKMTPEEFKKYADSTSQAPSKALNIIGSILKAIAIAALIVGALILLAPLTPVVVPTVVGFAAVGTAAVAGVSSAACSFFSKPSTELHAKSMNVHKSAEEDRVVSEARAARIGG